MFREEESRSPHHSHIYCQSKFICSQNGWCCVRRLISTSHLSCPRLWQAHSGTTCLRFPCSGLQTQVDRRPMWGRSCTGQWFLACDQQQSFHYLHDDGWVFNSSLIHFPNLKKSIYVTTASRCWPGRPFKTTQNSTVGMLLTSCSFRVILICTMLFLVVALILCQFLINLYIFLKELKVFSGISLIMILKYVEIKHATV